FRVREATRADPGRHQVDLEGAGDDRRRSRVSGSDGERRRAERDKRARRRARLQASHETPIAAQRLSRSKMLRVMRATNRSCPPRPYVHSVEPQLKTVPLPRVKVTIAAVP